VPGLDGELPGEECGSAFGAVFDDFEQVAPLGVLER
jgi:hypothetical protein